MRNSHIVKYKVTIMTNEVNLQDIKS